MRSEHPIDWSKIKALTFDIHGTLVDWDTGVIRAARATALGPHLQASDTELLEALEAHHARIEHEKPTMRKSEINTEGLKLYGRDLGLVENGKLTKEEMDQAAKDFGSSIGSFEAFGDTVNAIQRLAKHFILVPLTNMDHFSYNGTLAGPLAGCPFTASYLAEDIGSYKPSLTNFDYLLDHMKADHGVEKEDICHVAQSLFHDHGATKKIGLRSVWIDRYGVLQGMKKGFEDVQEEYGMKARFESLGELADLVEKELSN